MTINDLWGQSDIAYDAQGCHMAMNAKLSFLNTFSKVDLDWPLLTSGDLKGQNVIVCSIIEYYMNMLWKKYSPKYIF